ncbi:hypothetical protein Tco_1067650 [Tanacetum coccineum]|uniref:CCHC-type domain-containing protein n=1 Tax=Tanacetum coccineum TaxID=301880 RepID=A0ABQ5HDP1_9ASTR
MLSSAIVDIRDPAKMPHQSLTLTIVVTSAVIVRGFLSTSCTCVENGTPINVSTPYSSNDSPSVANHPPQPQYVPYSCELCGNDSHYGYDCPPQVPSLYKRRKKKSESRKNKRLEIDLGRFPFATMMTKTIPLQSHPFYQLGKDNSLSMGDEHLDTIPATESDEVIKSSVEDLVPIPSEPEGIPDSVCDVPLCNNPTPLNALNEHSEIVVNSNDDNSSSDDESSYGEDIDYIDASSPNVEIVSLEVVEIVDPEIDSLRDNPTPSSEVVIKSTSTFPNLFLEETNTFDNSFPESETFRFNLEEINGAELGNLTMDVVNDIFPTREPRVHVPNVLPTHLTLDTDFILLSEPLFAYIVWIFLPFLTYPVAPPYLLSCGNEDIIFDPGISNYHSFMPDVSHRSGTFMKFNVYPNHLNESPMMILPSTCFPMDQ